MQLTTARSLPSAARRLAGLFAISALSAVCASAQCTTVASDPNPVIAGANLTAAIAGAAPGAVLCIQPGTYQGTFTINGTDITLQPTGAALSVILDGAGSGPVLSIQNVSNATLISGMLVRNGAANDGGGMHILDASPQISACRIENNVAFSRGGGIYIEGANVSSAPRISSSYVTGNIADDRGGGIAFVGDTGSLTLSPFAILTNTTVRLNQAGTAGSGLGGGIYATVSNGNGISPQVSISRCRINENTVEGSGGGAAFHIGASLDFDHDWILLNSATNDGGGVWTDRGCTISVRSCHVEENQADMLGGGLCVLRYNSGDIRNSTIDANLLTSASSSGGGIYISNVNGSYNGGNTAEGPGADPQPGDPALLLVRNNLIVTNQAADGAGVTVEHATPLFAFNTFNANVATVGMTGGMLVNNPMGLVTVLTVRNSIYWGDIGTATPTFPWQVEFVDVLAASALTFNDVQGRLGGGWPYGATNIDALPLWVNGYTCPLAPIDGYFLSQPTPLSPCVDAGTGVLPPIMNGRSTKSTGAADTGAVDLGYHYPPTNCP